MLDILISCWDLIWGLIEAVGSILGLVGVWAWEIISTLHTKYPRLEGLLVGITLTWVLLRREKHPLLRVVSAPLKLVLDILDLAWDQVGEVVSDLWGTATGWIKKSVGWASSKASSAYRKLLSGLSGIRDRLKRNDESSE